MADIADKQLKTLKKLIETAETNLAGARELLASLVSSEQVELDIAAASPSGKVVEGQFDGQNMVDDEGKTYPVPANYASKSKLIPGDRLKLSIGDDGAFIYKQIGPVERQKMVGVLKLENGQYWVEANSHKFRVLFASVTYFKAHPGDQVALVVPEAGESEWGAIEAVIG